MPGLLNGDRLPNLNFETVAHGHLKLPDYLAGSYGVILGYRGSWCPYCNAQLASFERRLGALVEAGIKVVAVSSDDLDHAKESVDKHHLTFPVGYGLDAETTAQTLGGYWNEGRRALESTDLLLNAEGRIEVAVYSSKVIGRLVVDDVLGYVEHLKKR